MTSWDEYDSGPFCTHWSEAYSCEIKCSCGHACKDHNFFTDQCEECGCVQFRDTAIHRKELD